MNIDQPEMDPISAFLNKSCDETNEKLRLLIQQKTLAVMRRRRWLRQTSWLAGLAACYAAGILTMSIWPRPEQNLQVATAPEQNSDPQANPAPAPSDSKHPIQAPSLETALAMEWKALDSPEKRPDLFRLAGDK